MSPYLSFAALTDVAKGETERLPVVATVYEAYLCLRPDRCPEAAGVPDLTTQSPSER